MKVIYGEDPFNVSVVLDETEKMQLWYLIKINKLEELMFEAHYFMKENDHERVKAVVDPKYYCTDDRSPLDKSTDASHQMYLEELEVGTHCGDCICVPCSCSRCWAESIVGIDTLPGLGKHQASGVDKAYRDQFREEGTRSIDNSIERLRNFDARKAIADWGSEVLARYTPEDIDDLVERWTREHAQGLEWLVSFKETKANTIDLILMPKYTMKNTDGKYNV